MPSRVPTVAASTRRKGAYPNTVSRFTRAGVNEGWAMFRKFPMYQPRAVRWVGTFSFAWQIAASATARFSGKCFRLNSIRDPIARAGASQPSVWGYSTMALLYDRYRVYFTTLQARWWNRRDMDLSPDVIQKLAWGDGQVLYIETGATVDTTTLSREAVTDSITNRPDADSTEGLWWENTTQFPEQVQKLAENGALFQGGNKWQVMAPRNTAASGGDATVIPTDSKSNKLFAPRIAMSWAMKDLSLHSSKSEFEADEAWGCAFNTDPVEQRYCGVGWGNGSYNADAVNPESRPVVGGYMTVKMKYYTVLSHKRPIESFRTLTAA